MSPRIKQTCFAFERLQRLNHDSPPVAQPVALPMPLRAVHCLLLHDRLLGLMCTEERSYWTTELGNQLRSLPVPCEFWKQLCPSAVSVAPTLALQLTLLTSLHIQSDSGGRSIFREVTVAVIMIQAVDMNLCMLLNCYCNGAV